MNRRRRQIFLNVADRFGHPRRGFAGGRGERDAERFAARFLREEKLENAHDRPGLAGARTASDDGEIVRDGSSGGDLLQICPLPRSERPSCRTTATIACASCCSYSQ